MSSQEFIQKLLEELRPLRERYLDNKLFKAIRNGSLSKQGLRAYVKQRYYFTRHAVDALIALPVVRAPTKRLRDQAVEHFKEEVWHLDTLVRLAKALGINEEELEMVQPTPMTEAYTRWMQDISDRGHFLDVHVEAFIAEGAFALAAGEIGRTLVDKYGLSKEDVEFYGAHAEADVEHEQQGREMIEKYATAPELQEHVRRVAIRNLEFSILFHEAIHDHLGEGPVPGLSIYAHNK